MVKEQKTTEETLSELKEDITRAKRRIKFSKDFEKEVRRIISRLYIIDTREKSLSLFKSYFPERLPVDWYQKSGKEYFNASSFIPDDYNDWEIEEFEKFLYNNLNELLEICEQVVDDAIFELERFDKAQQPTVKKKTTKPKVAKIEPKPKKAPIITKPKEKKEKKIQPRVKEKKSDEKPSIGYIKLPIPFTDIKFEIDRRDLGIFLLGILAGIIIIISAILGIDFISGL